MQKNHRIIVGDCLEELAKLRDVDLIFADPPYNQGIDYGNGAGADFLPKKDYIGWTIDWLGAALEALIPWGSLWVVLPDEWVAQVAVNLEAMGMYRRNWIKWYETFGNNCTRKFNRTSRHLLYYTKHRQHFTFDADAVRVPSDRQLKYNDRRANPAGKVMDDVWTIPRVCGTHKERIPGVPTQLPLELVSRAVRSCTNTGDLVVDPFCGSGTTGEAALRHGCRFIGIDLSEEYCEIANCRLNLCRLNLLNQEKSS